MRVASPSSSKGFTLIELVVTVTIVGILASLAIPGMRQLIHTQYVRSGAGDLQTALFYARSEAIKRAVDVRVVPTGGKWTGGWSVQLPDNSVLRKQDALSSTLVAISGSTITYQFTGRVSAVPAQIVFKTSDADVTARCVKVDLGGRPSVVYDTNANASDGCN